MRWVRVVVLLGLLIAPTTSRAVGQEAPPTTGAVSAAPVAPSNAAEMEQERAPDAPAAGGAAVTLPPPTTVASAADDASWVATHQSTDLWSDSDLGRSFGTVRPFTYFQLTGQAADGRLYVYNPRTQNYAWVEAEAVGPVPPPSEAYFKGPQPLAEIDKPGRVVGGFNMRSWPAVRDDTMLRALAHNAPLFVQEAVVGDDGETWYRVGEDEYVHASGVRLPKPPPRTFSGRWIDVDLSEPAMLAAYEGDQLVYTTLTIKGTAVDPTPLGVHTIQRRVANEIMDSATVGIPRNSPRGYYLTNVLYTQYFTGSGASLHYNYWSSVFGYAGSHGCLGLSLEDSLWFWNWANMGTVLNIHY
jgi:hypothetical protein